MSDLARQLLSELSTEFGRRSNQDFQSLEAGKDRAFRSSEGDKQRNSALSMVQEENKAFLEKLKAQLDYASREKDKDRINQTSENALNRASGVDMANIQNQPALLQVWEGMKRLEKEKEDTQLLLQSTYSPMSTKFGFGEALSERGGVLGMGLDETDMSDDFNKGLGTLKEDVKTTLTSKIPKDNAKRRNLEQLITALYKKMNTTEFRDGDIGDIFGDTSRYEDDISQIELLMNSLGMEFDPEPK